MSQSEQTIHLPDTEFQVFCETAFGINRGVYNVIDYWFFENGIQHVVARRKEIVNFLQLQRREIRKDGSVKIRFGKNGLKNRLEGYRLRIVELEVIYS